MKKIIMLLAFALIVAVSACSKSEKIQVADYSFELIPYGNISESKYDEMLAYIDNAEPEDVLFHKIPMKEELKDAFLKKIQTSDLTFGDCFSGTFVSPDEKDMYMVFYFHKDKADRMDLYYGQDNR